MHGVGRSHQGAATATRRCSWVSPTRNENKPAGPNAARSPTSTATGRSGGPAKDCRPIAKANCEPKRFIREFRTDGDPHGLEVGETVNLSVLSEVPRVDLIGLTKGRGHTGVMKRHNFQGQGATHGVKRMHRHGGSIGASADPSRVVKGKRMPGRYGGEQVTMRNISRVQVRRGDEHAARRGGRSRSHRRLGDDSTDQEACEKGHKA